MDQLESYIKEEFDRSFLDASLVSITLYEKRGYRTIEHSKIKVANDCVLVYETMEKVL